MRFYECIGQLILVYNVMVICDLDKTRLTKERTFSDVLKNITMANKILQDLINNYERLEKIWKNDDLNSDKSSSSENYGKFKTKNSDDEHKDRSYHEHTTRSSYFQGTAIIYDSEREKVSKEKISEVNESLDTNEETKESSNKEQQENKSLDTNEETKEFSNKEQHVIKTKQNEIHLVNDTSENDDSLSEEIQSEEVEEVSIELPKKKPKAVILKPKQPIKNNRNKIVTNILGEKTRFSIQHAIPRNLRSKNYNSNGRRIKRIVYSEKFSPNTIWKEIISKPIKLERDEDYYHNFNKNNDPNFKSKKNETILVMVLTNDKEKTKAKLAELNESGTTHKYENTELLDKILRSTYGEACLQMPVRKCKKAIKAMIKTVCKRRLKCKYDFKSDFLENSKKCCENEFSYAMIEDTNKKNSNKPESNANQDNSSLDITRGYKVLPDYKIQAINHFISLRNETPQLAKRKLNILRDKYEKKCQKESRKKCIAACEYSLKETCSIHNCEERKKKVFKRECKNECKRKFYVKGSKSDSETEYSDSESDSDTDSKS